MKFPKIYPPYFQCHLVSPVTLFHFLASGERGNCYRNFRWFPWNYVKLLYLLCFRIYKPHPIEHHRIPLNSTLNVVSYQTQNFPNVTP